MSSRLRLLLASVLLSSWMVSLMTGYAFEGWAHLLLVLALFLFPWRAAFGDADEGSGDTGS